MAQLQVLHAQPVGQLHRCGDEQVGRLVIVGHHAGAVEVGQTDEETAEQPGADVGQGQHTARAVALDRLQAVGNVAKAFLKDRQPGGMTAEGTAAAVAEIVGQTRVRRGEVVAGVRADLDCGGQKRTAHARKPFWCPGRCQPAPPRLPCPSGLRPRDWQGQHRAAAIPTAPHPPQV